MNHISPSLLCANPINLEKDILELNKLAIDWFHLDVMDGSFVPNFALGADSIRGIRSVAKKPLYAHVMALNPERHVESFAKLGVDYFCFHIETTTTPFRLCSHIREHGMKPAVAFNPSTPLERLSDLASYVDAITLMGVEPGYSGQKFLPFIIEKVSAARSIIGERNVIIEVDGGLDNALAVKCIEAGCDVAVGGYFILFQQSGTISSNHESFLKSLGGH